MGELLELSTRIEKILSWKSNTPMSQEDFEAQKRNFVIGNSFDVYADGDTISDAMITVLEKRRLDTRK